MWENTMKTTKSKIRRVLGMVEAIVLPVWNDRRANPYVRLPTISINQGKLKSNCGGPKDDSYRIEFTQPNLNLGIYLYKTYRFSYWSWQITKMGLNITNLDRVSNNALELLNYQLYLCPSKNDKYHKIV